MKKQLNCLVLNPAFSVAGVQKKNTVISIPCGAIRHPVVLTAQQRFYIDYILRNCEGAINFPLLQQYRQATTPVARQDYDNAVVQAFIIAISTLTRNRVIPTKEEAVQARTDCLEVLYFTTPFWDPTDNTDKIKGAQQASKETSSASGDEAESSSSESIDELRGKKVVECNMDDDQEEHKEKTTTRKRTREESNDEDRTWWSLQPTEAWDIHDIDTMSLQDARTALRQAVSNAKEKEEALQAALQSIQSLGERLLVPAQQQDQIIKGLEAARAKLKEKIATYKKEQVRVTNELHEQHVLVATLKSQNEGLKEQLELLKSERANWREYESLKGTSTTPSKHKHVPATITADITADI
eukprot:m51a1_g11813 hypothetical protein (355) ;mRNA; r:384131-386304